nr:HD domain-containing protein [Burkholderiales bacterium]
MVSVVSANGNNQQDKAQLILSHLSGQEAEQVRQALAYASDRSAGKLLDTGQSAFTHMLGVAAQLAELNTDGATRIAGLLAALTFFDPQLEKNLLPRFGADVSKMLGSIRQLLKLRSMLSGAAGLNSGANATALWTDQVEVIRKMLLGMASDVRVVLIRLSSRLQTLRYFSSVESVKQQEGPLWLQAKLHAQETLDLYAPLANRLGVWQLKWELEDLAFRLLQPRVYKSIARMLDEKRMEREQFIEQSMRSIREKLAAQDIACEVSGRPKHIFSIYNKMQ